MQRRPLHFCDILRSVSALRRRVLSVGRLDVNTSGLLLLTNCGHLKQVSAHGTHRLHNDAQYASCVHALTPVAQALEQPNSNIDR